MKIGEILDGDVPRWEVFSEADGTVLVERDAMNGSEDDVYATLADLKESLAVGYTFRSSIKASEHGQANGEFTMLLVAGMASVWAGCWLAVVLAGMAGVK